MEGLPAWLWYLSVKLHHQGIPFLPKMIKMLNFFLFKNLLPYQAELGSSIVLGHFGLGVVIHPHVTIGSRVKIWQHVTVAAETTPTSKNRVYIGDDVMIGAGATIVARKAKDLRIGAGAQIGAGAVVTGDVPAGAVMVGIPARQVGCDADVYRVRQPAKAP